MLHLLLCSDVHTYTDNIRLAIAKMPRVDAVLIAGDLETDLKHLAAAVGSTPCHAVCGNWDNYTKMEYPQELLLDIEAPFSSADIQASDDGTFTQGPDGASFPFHVRELSYDSVPGRYAALPEMIRKLMPASLAGKIVREKRKASVSHRILMTHGKEYGVPDLRLLSRRAEVWNADLVIFGHTHLFADISLPGQHCRLINPGCLLGDPRKAGTRLGEFMLCSFAMLTVGARGEIDVQQMHL